MDYARKNCQGWRDTEARMANAEAFLKTMKPLLLKDAPGGAALSDAARPRRSAPGGERSPKTCASCHSSKQPPAGIAPMAKQWFRDAVAARRLPRRTTFCPTTSATPSSALGTNVARALATNATARATSGISSRRRPTSSCRASAGSPTSTTRASRPSPSTFDDPRRRPRLLPDALARRASGRRRRTCTTTRVGIYVKDPSVQGA